MSIQRTPEETAYRRGFDQGVVFLLYDIGLTNEQVRDIYYVKKVGHWRHFRGVFRNLFRDPAPRMSVKERNDMRRLLRRALSEIGEEQ